MKPAYLLRVVVVAWALLLTACVNDEGGSSTPTPSPPATYYPRFGFGVNQGDDTLSVYLINAATGQWLHHGYATTGANPVAVAVSANEKFVYVANGAGTISAFTLDATSGRLTLAETQTAGTNPVALAVAPNNALMYVLNAGDNQIVGYAINGSSGVLDPVVGGPVTVGTAPSALVIHPTRTLMYVASSGSNNVYGFSVNPTSGALTALTGSPYTVGTNPQDLTIDPSGRFLYVANKDSNNLTAYKIDSTTGVLSGMSTATAGNGPSSITVAAGGQYVYAANYIDGTISIFSLDATTGALSLVSTQPTSTSSGFLRADPSGKFLFVNSGVREMQAYDINTTNGGLTALSVTRTRSQPAMLAMSSGTSSISPQPRYAYAVDSTHASVRAHSVSTSSGALSYLSSADSGNNPAAVTVDPFSRFVYVVNNSDDSLSGYSINDTTGSLIRIDLNPGNVSTNDLPVGDIDPQHVVVDPSGRFLYVSLTTAAVTGQVRAFSIATNGTLTEISGSPYTVGANLAGAPKQLSIDPTGQYLFVVNQTAAAGNGFISSFSINPASGQLTSLSADLPVGSNPQSIAIEPSGRFAYVGNRGASNSGTTLTRINIAPDGLISSPGDTNTIAGPVDLAMDPLGHFAYVAAAGLPGLLGYDIASTDGTLTAIGTPTSTSPTPACMEIDPSGRFAYVGYSNDLNISVYSINGTNGSLTATSTTASTDFPLSIALSRRLVSSSSPSGNWR